MPQNYSLRIVQAVATNKDVPALRRPLKHRVPAPPARGLHPSHLVARCRIHKERFARWREDFAHGRGVITDEGIRAHELAVILSLPPKLFDERRRRWSQGFSVA